MAFTMVTLVYKANPSGQLTATQLETAMAAAPLVTTFWANLLSVIVSSQTGAVVGGQAVMTLVLAFAEPVFSARFPSVMNGTSFGPFANLFSGRLRALVKQPVLAAVPVIS